MTSMMRTLILVAGTLICSFIANQIYTNGISWSFLKPAQTTTSPGEVYADSAFGLVMDGTAIFVDVRATEDYEIDRIPSAISVPLHDFYHNEELRNIFEADNQYVVYCFEADCLESGWLARELKRIGIENVGVLQGGFSQWLEFGFPIDAEQVL